MEWVDSAIVLYVGRFREADMWLRLLTQRHGIVNVFAFGGSRSRKRFCGCLDLLNTLSCRVRGTRKGTYLSLEEGTLLHGPMRLRSDWQRLGLAVNCVRFTDAMGVSIEGGTQVFGLLQDAVRGLEGEEMPHILFPLLYRLRLASEQGQAPALDICGECGCGVDAGIFRVDEGQMLCPHCASSMESLRYYVSLPPAGLELMRHAQQSSPAVWGDVPVDGQTRRAVARAIDGFVQYHLGIAWQNGRFCRV